MKLSDLMFWKHKEKEEVIQQECYDKLPEHHKVNYVQTNQQPTHIVEQVDRTDSNDDGILLTALATSAVISSIESSDMSYDMGGSYDPSDSFDSSNNFDGFGGGDSGGGGASGDW